jgi:mRNA-degrading endonuclease toxin of MazEF toxin-antitoxin module
VTAQGDIHLADLNEERRRRVLVVSTVRFNRMTRRVVVIPEVGGAPDEVPFPWRIEVEGAVFAVDLLRSMPAERLLQRTGRATHATMLQVRRAIQHII